MANKNQLKYNDNEAINMCKNIHGNEYTYAHFHYNGRFKKSIFTCPIHGDFEMVFNNFLKGRLCQKCSKAKKEEAIKQKINNNAPNIINKIQKIWGNKLLLNKFVYNGYKKYSIFTCPIHGDFKSTPNHILEHKGCKECKKNSISKALKLTQEEILNKFLKKYNDKYSYEHFIYNGYNEKCIITCKKHGDFITTPHNFLSLHECPKCNHSMLEGKIIDILNKNNINYIYQYKLNNNKPYDFYIPKYNILIECQGEQHFVPVGFGGKSNLLENKIIEFHKRIDYDIEKYNNAVQHGVKIIYFCEPSNFKKEFRNINIFDGWYKDKYIYTNINNVLHEILNYNG